MTAATKSPTTKYSSIETFYRGALLLGNFQSLVHIERNAAHRRRKRDAVNINSFSRRWDEQKQPPSKRFQILFKFCFAERNLSEDIVDICELVQTVFNLPFIKSSIAF